MKNSHNCIQNYEVTEAVFISCTDSAVSYILNLLSSLNANLSCVSGEFSHKNLSLQCEQPWYDLSGHSQGQLESSTDHIKGPAVHLFPPHGL